MLNNVVSSIYFTYSMYERSCCMHQLLLDYVLSFLLAGTFMGYVLGLWTFLGSSCSLMGVFGSLKILLHSHLRH